MLDAVGETRGIYTNGTLLFTIYNADFRQNSNPYTDYNFSQRTKQVGIKVKRLGVANNNTFTLLHTGIEFSDVLLTNPFNSLGTVNTSTFTRCQKGIEVSGIGTNRPSDVNCCPPCTPTVYLPLYCNTFDRGDATLPGIAYGIVVGGTGTYSSGSRVILDPLPTSSSPFLPHSNKFLDYLAGTSGYYAIYNGSCVSQADFKYTTFPEYIATSPTPPLFLNHSQLSSLINNKVSLFGMGTYRTGQTCGFGSPGLERTSNGTKSLAQSSPNPATESTTFAYQLTTDTHSAELRVSRGTDGRQLQRYSLPLQREGTYELKLRGWQPGMYFITLYADEAPVQTRRLLVH